MKVFHRENFFYNAKNVWEKYSNDTTYFNFPERVTIEITNRCNLQCFMCPRNKVKMKLGNMSEKLFKKIIDETSNFLPVAFVPFFRGESLLHHNFLKMLSYAKDKGLKPIQLATNAYFLDTKFTHELLNLGIDFISFSVDVNNPLVYKKIRKNSDFEKVFSNIICFLKAKEDRKLYFPEIQISAVKTNENKLYIKNFIDFWITKVDRVRIYYAHSLDGKLGYLESDRRHYKRKPCLKLLTDIVVYWNGDVALCNHDWQRDIFIGNVKDNSIKEIWQNQAYTGIRERHINNNLKDFSPCNYCSHWKVYYNKDYIMGKLYEGKISHN